MVKHKSVSQRLRTTRKPEVMRQICAEWSAGWEEDQLTLIADIEGGIRRQDVDALIRAIGQLRAVTVKRFDGLNSVLGMLCDRVDDAQTALHATED